MRVSYIFSLAKNLLTRGFCGLVAVGNSESKGSFKNPNPERVECRVRVSSFFGDVIQTHQHGVVVVTTYTQNQGTKT